MTARYDQIRAVIFDWAGTVVDFGSRAPMGAFVEAFRSFDVDITVAEARAPMGLPKRDHIAAIMADERIAAAWRDRHGNPPSDADIDAVYDVFVPLNVKVVTDYADLIPGAADMAAALRAQGIKIGSTTGYTREIMERLMPVAAEQGFAPDTLVCTGDLPKGRPTPFNIYKTLLDLQVHPAWRCVKVDDTVPGIAEGVAAGCWVVGVALSGNGVGLSLDELLDADEDEVEDLSSRAADELLAAGAHLIIDTVADLPSALAEIQGCLLRGERP